MCVTKLFLYVHAFDSNITLDASCRVLTLHKCCSVSDIMTINTYACTHKQFMTWKNLNCGPNLNTRPNATIPAYILIYTYYYSLVENTKKL